MLSENSATSASIPLSTIATDSDLVHMRISHRATELAHRGNSIVHGEKAGAARALPSRPLPKMRAAQRRRRLDVDRRVEVMLELQEDLRLNPGGRMLMQKPLAVNNHSFDVLQRAFDGACWSVGISRYARRGEIKEISETRKTIALTVLRCAASGARDVQVLKANALRSLFSRGRRPLLAHQLG